MVQHALLNEGCIIDGEIRHSVVSQGVVVEKEAVVKDCVIMPNVRIGRGSFIERAIVMEDIYIPEGTKIYNDSDEVFLITEEFLAAHRQEQKRVNAAR
jgi:glucose-1-phosphate adenylyltransferase